MRHRRLPLRLGRALLKFTRAKNPKGHPMKQINTLWLPIVCLLAAVTLAVPGSSWALADPEERKGFYFALGMAGGAVIVDGEPAGNSMTPDLLTWIHAN